MEEGTTIFALASGVLPCAIAVMRISGPQAGQVPALLGAVTPKPRQAGLRRLRDPRDGSLIDEALLLFFPGPASATGEDVLEIQCHGSRAVVQALESALASFPRFRRAGAGDFTRRAFSNGRLNLMQVEALGDLLSAETDRQRRAALSLWEGGLTADLDRVRSALLRCAAKLELSLDFADEDDAAAQQALFDTVQVELGEQRDVLHRLSQRPDNRRLRDGIRLVLAGSPNAGKSTLFNALIGRDAAIVSDEAGTTRDVVEAMVERGGLSFIVSDTAGLRDVRHDSVEGQGIARAQAMIGQADILLWLDPGPPPIVAGAHSIAIAPKADLREVAYTGRLAVSAKTGAGVEALWATILTAAAPLVPALGEFGVSERQASRILQAEAALRDAMGQADDLLIAEHVRIALSAIDQLVGRASTEAMLDTLFSGFCIGK